MVKFNLPVTMKEAPPKLLSPFNYFAKKNANLLGFAFLTNKPTT
jgi:hypothetical protein